MIEYSYVKLAAKAANPARPSVAEKPTAFSAFQGDKRLYRITREGDTVTVESADPAHDFRVVEIPWSGVEFAERLRKREPRAEPVAEPQRQLHRGR